jgi:hypothetical protein
MATTMNTSGERRGVQTATEVDQWITVEQAKEATNLGRTKL